MLQDRPAMAQFGERAGVLYQWAGRKFAGEDLYIGRAEMSDHLADNNPFLLVQSIVHWNASEPDAVDADSLHPSTERPGLIRIRKTYSDGLNKGKEQSFEELSLALR